MNTEFGKGAQASDLAARERMGEEPLHGRRAASAMPYHGMFQSLTEAAGWREDFKLAGDCVDNVRC